MGFQDEFLWTGKTYAQWSLEKTIEQRLEALQGTVESRLKSLQSSSSPSSSKLREEIAYQTEQLLEQNRRGSAETATAIHQMAEYLGAELCEIRWAVEFQTGVSEEILNALVNSLENKSRQYWEQGVKCYNAGAVDLAKHCFEDSVQADRTNFSAYEFLGFIAATNGNSEEALRNFELTRKFAPTDHHRALALSHLASTHHAKGELEVAADFSGAAAGLEPNNAAFWYRSAAYSAHVGRVQPMVDALRRAIELDWNYWGLAATDPNFDPVRIHIDHLFDDLREREQGKAAKAIEQVRRAIEQSKNWGIPDDLLIPCTDAMNILKEKLNRSNFHIYRELLVEAREVPCRAYSIAERNISERIEKARSLRQTTQAELEGIKTQPRIKAFLFGLLCTVVVFFLVGLFFVTTTRMDFDPSFVITILLVLPVAVGIVVTLFVHNRSKNRNAGQVMILRQRLQGVHTVVQQLSALNDQMKQQAVRTAN